MIRRSLTESTPAPPPGLQALRRVGGARRNVGYRIRFLRGADELEGWALNLSRGGVRAVLDENLVPGETVHVVIDEISMHKSAKVAWVQVEPDGAIVGVAFDEPLSEPPEGVNLEASIGDGRTHGAVDPRDPFDLLDVSGLLPEAR